MNPSFRRVKFGTLVPPQMAGDQAMQLSVLTNRAFEDGVIIEPTAEITATPLHEIEGVVDTPLKMLRLVAYGYCTHKGLTLSSEIHRINAMESAVPVRFLAEIRAVCTTCRARFAMGESAVLTTALIELPE
jgi:hypothetical protein